MRKEGGLHLRIKKSPNCANRQNAATRPGEEGREGGKEVRCKGEKYKSVVWQNGRTAMTISEKTNKREKKETRRSRAIRNCTETKKTTEEKNGKDQGKVGSLGGSQPMFE